jgi:TonB family protein
VTNASFQLHLAASARAATCALVLLLLPGPGTGTLAGQACEEGTAPDYAELMGALSRLRPTLDTMTLRGKLHVTVRRTNGQLEASLIDGHVGAGVTDSGCRGSYLWTSRGDSLIALWSVSPVAPPTPAGGQDPPPSFLDKPRPVPYTARARVVAPQIARALLAAYQRSSGAPAEPTTTELLLLVDSTGRGAVSRIARSSGIRRLDEAALRIATELSYVPARDRDRAVSVWYAMLVRWHPRRDSVDLRCC